MLIKRKPTKYGRLITFIAIVFFLYIIIGSFNSSIDRHKVNMRQFKISQPRHLIEFNN